MGAWWQESLVLITIFFYHTISSIVNNNNDHGSVILTCPTQTSCDLNIPHQIIPMIYHKCRDTTNVGTILCPRKTDLCSFQWCKWWSVSYFRHVYHDIIVITHSCTKWCIVDNYHWSIKDTKRHLILRLTLTTYCKLKMDCFRHSTSTIKPLI